MAATPPTPTHVASDSTITTPLVLTASTSGDLLLIFTRDAANQYSTGVTDSAGGTWTMLSASPTSGTVGRRVELWVKMDSPAITSVSIAFASSSTAHAALIKLNDIDPDAPQGPYATTFQASTTTPTELTAALSENNMLVISTFQSNSNTQANHLSETDWTRGTTSSTGPAWAWRNDLGIVTSGCTWTTTVAQGSGTGIITFYAAPDPTIDQTLIGNEVPVSHDLSDGVPFTLGTKFEPLVPLLMTHFRWYVPVTAQPGAASVEFSLWDTNTQTILLTQEFDTTGFEDEYVEVELADGPYLLSAGTPEGYTVTVWTPGRYVSTPFVTWSDYGTPDVVTCPQPAGLYNYNSSVPTYPIDEAGSSNYFIDIVYDLVPLPAVSVWDGTTEVLGSVTVWNGTDEVSASFSSIV